LRDGGERVRERRKLWMIMITCTNFKLIREPLGSSWPQGGSGCSGWRMNATKKVKNNLQEDVESGRNLRSKKGDALLRLFGTNSFKEEAMSL
jgi:hypothetical protein